jgi:hypothetical protein
LWSIFTPLNNALVDDVRGFISAIIILYADDGGFEVAIMSVRIPGTAVLEYDKPKLGSSYFPVLAEDVIVFVLHAALLRCKWSSTLLYSHHRHPKHSQEPLG